jgi:hypothetical protein
VRTTPLHIVIPVKNSPESTSLTIEAVINSKSEIDFELTVYDDFSEKETADMLDKLASKYNFKVVHLSEVTANPSPNYRLVLQMAQTKAVSSGAHIVIVESDVTVNEDTISKLYNSVNNLNNDFPGSKSWSIDNVARRTTGPKRHFSTTEYGFFRGGAAMFEFNNVSLTAFYSNRLIDTNISDSGEITSFKTDGLHRTPLEISKKKNTREQVIGTNINYRYNRFQTGISGVYHIYNKMYNPVLRDYNKYYLRDQSNLNASIDYSYQLPGFILAGETAIAKNGAVATINSLQYRPVTDISFTLLYRKYPITYNALHAQAFSEGSRVQNENGIFIATAFKPVKRLTVNSYLDLVRFPWKKYGVNGPSKAMDLYFKSSYTFSEHSYIEARYKFKRKEKNLDNPELEEKSVLPYITNKLRLRYSQENSSGWNFRSTVDFAGGTVEPAAGVMATKPAITPVQKPTTVGFLLII